MPKVAYDIFSPPLVEKLTLLNADILFDTSVSPIQLKGWYEPNYKIGVKITSDGQLYLDSALTLGLFASALPPHPTTGNYDYLLAYPMKNALVAVWLGKTTSDYDTPVILAVNKTIGALLVYNASSQTVQVNHHSSVYPNYETDGTYSAGVVTLNAGQYALFYGATKPTVNAAAKWGFTDYEPKSTTAKPTRYLDVCKETAHYYFENTLDINGILDFEVGAILAEVNGIITYYPGLWFRMNIRGGRDADGIEIMPPGGGYAVSFVLRPNNLFEFPVYDHDPPAGISWSQGQVVDNLSYVRDDGVSVFFRLVKTTTDPYNPRYTWLGGLKYAKDGLTTVRLKGVSVTKSLTGITSYGSANEVINPGLGFDCYAEPTTFEYYNGVSWLAATPGSNTYNYYNGYGIRAQLYNPLNTSEVYRAVAFMRKYMRYATAPIRVGSLQFSAYPNRGLLAVFIDYSGAIIPIDNYVNMIFEVAITKETTYPTISTEESSEDTALWSYLYGYPYNLSVSAPSSASPGQLVTVTVTTNAPDGRKVYAVDKDNDEILGSGTVSGGQATIQFNMPNRNLNIRVYVEGADIALA